MKGRGGRERRGGNMRTAGCASRSCRWCCEEDAVPAPEGDHTGRGGEKRRVQQLQIR